MTVGILLFVCTVPLSATDSIDMYALARLESGFNPRAVSPAGARGLYQIMPDTWRSFAEPAQRWDHPRDSRIVADRYLAWIRQTLRQWGDLAWSSPAHVLAAYNGGITRFKQAGFNLRNMPPETRRYVARYQQLARRK